MQFRQSLYDFPLTVSLGKNTPSFGLHRFKQGLRFVPPDDERFTLRGDKQRLVYKGRRRSHRFTILGDCSFEYDCILLREPESNVISLRMEGAENFDFFRQPDFVTDPFLKGSYAVYKKETLIGEGTGKLCHIHRPEIIDARGRRCWGGLSVVGNCLFITIPEKWLGEAAYPVIVDPTVGTSTIGSFAYPVENPDKGSSFTREIAVNRFLAPEKIEGQCTAWAYFSFIKDYIHYYSPRIFSDDNNRPLIRRSCNEGEAVWGRFLDDNFHVIPNENPPKWKSASFDVIGSINQGSYIWFGGYSDSYCPRFDYGSIMYKAYLEYIYEDDDDEEGTEYLDFPYFGYERTYDRKVSWYFEFISLSQNYVRKLTQGVKLTDKRKLAGNYKRTAKQTVKVNSALKRFETFIRKCVMTVKNTMMINRLPLFFRNVTEQIKITMVKNEILSLSRKCADDVKINSDIKRFQNVIRLIKDGLKILDTQSFSVLFVRPVHDTATAAGYFSRLGAFIRGLPATAGSNAGTTHNAEYYRFNSDTVQAEGKANKGLLLFIRIITGVFIRDYLLRRFLKAREELILKSAICQEIILESRID